MTHTLALALVLAAPALAAPAEGMSPPPDAASIIGITGSAFVHVGDAPVVVLDRCAGLPLGARVCTGPGSFATVRLSGDPRVQGADDIVLMPQTCLNIEAASADRTQIEVTQGGIAVPERTARASSTSTLAIRTRDGLAEGREGGFRIALEDDATRSEAVSGSLRLTGAGGSLDLVEGKGSRLRPGAAPDAPTDLIRPEALLQPGPDAVLVRPDFRWTPFPLGTGYRVELSADPSFTDIVEAIDLADPWWLPEFLFAPKAVEGLWWRVAAYDRLGFLGIPSAPSPLRLPAGVRG